MWLILEACEARWFRFAESGLHQREIGAGPEAAGDFKSSKPGLAIYE